MSDRRPKEKDRSNKVNLSTPWSGRDEPNGYSSRDRNVLSNWSAASDIVAETFVVERTRLHELYIREQEKTKRVSVILGAVLILGAAAMILFAPSGREALSYWIGAALVIFAAGAMGYKRVWGKTKNMSFGADQDQREM